MYLDTSIIIKLLVPEEESRRYEEILVGERIGSSELAYLEVWSALLGKERSHILSTRDRELAWKTFLDWQETKQLTLYPLHAPALKRATRMIEATHPAVPLRALDAIHLAACDLSQDFPLCTHDHRMREAAALLKIPCFPEHAEN